MPNAESPNHPDHSDAANREKESASCAQRAKRIEKGLTAVRTVNEWLMTADLLTKVNGQGGDTGGKRKGPLQ
jgi:hypothetical protein